MKPPLKHFLIVIFLITSTLSVFWPVNKYGFINYDDRVYVTENANINSGWTKEGIVWAFTSRLHGHFHPLTWLSHMTDCQFFDLNPKGHHQTNLIIHLLNTILVFFLFNSMTGSIYKSAFVAALFSLHPLHVEPVTSIAGRKDLLSGFFWFAAIYTYFLYFKKKNWQRFICIFLFFVLGLLSKAVVITLPLILILMDFWPLGRFTQVLPPSASSNGAANTSVIPVQDSQVRHILFEKIGLFAAMVSFGLFALLVMQRSISSVDFGALLPSKFHLANAPISYVIYLRKMFWPFDLAIPYPFQGMPPVWQIYASVTFLAIVSYVAIKLKDKYNYLFFGWFWFIITLMPMIGILGVGPQAMADRYTYIPAVGITVLLVWGVCDLTRAVTLQKQILLGLSVFVLAFMVSLSSKQVSYWQDSLTLFERTVRLTPKSPVAHFSYGYSLELQQEEDKAIHHYKEALRFSPSFVQVNNNLGALLVKKGMAKEAIPYLKKALDDNPGTAVGQINLANALAYTGQLDEAILHYQEALKINSSDASAHMNIGVILAGQGKFSQAIDHYSKALELQPESVETHYNLAGSLAQSGEINGAIFHYQTVLNLNPEYFAAYFNLAVVFFQNNQLNVSAEYFLETLRIKPDMPLAHRHLANIYLRQGRKARAQLHLDEEKRLSEKKPNTYPTL